MPRPSLSSVFIEIEVSSSVLSAAYVFISSRSSSFFLKYSSSDSMNLSTRGSATINCTVSLFLRPITLMSSPDSGNFFLKSEEFRNLSVSSTRFSVGVIGAYPTAAEVSFAPRMAFFLLKISVSSTEPRAISTWYSIVSGFTNLRLSLIHFFAVSMAMVLTSMNSPSTSKVALSPKMMRMGFRITPPPNGRASRAPSTMT